VVVLYHLKQSYQPKIVLWENGKKIIYGKKCSGKNVKINKMEKEKQVFTERQVLFNNIIGVALIGGGIFILYKLFKNYKK
jgi:hypothetical protein